MRKISERERVQRAKRHPYVTREIRARAEACELWFRLGHSALTNRQARVLADDESTLEARAREEGASFARTVVLRIVEPVRRRKVEPVEVLPDFEPEWVRDPGLLPKRPPTRSGRP